MAAADWENVFGQVLGDLSLFVRPLSQWGNIPLAMTQREAAARDPTTRAYLEEHPFRAGLLGFGTEGGQVKLPTLDPRIQVQEDIAGLQERVIRGDTDLTPGQARMLKLPPTSPNLVPTTVPLVYYDTNTGKFVKAPTTHPGAPDLVPAGPPDTYYDSSTGRYIHIPPGHPDQPNLVAVEGAKDWFYDRSTGKYIHMAAPPPEQPNLIRVPGADNEFYDPNKGQYIHVGPAGPKLGGDVFQYSPEGLRDAQARMEALNQIGVPSRVVLAPSLGTVTVVRGKDTTGGITLEDLGKVIRGEPLGAPQPPPAVPPPEPPPTSTTTTTEPGGVGTTTTTQPGVVPAPQVAPPVPAGVAGEKQPVPGTEGLPGGTATTPTTTVPPPPTLPPTTTTTAPPTTTTTAPPPVTTTFPKDMVPLDQFAPQAGAGGARGFPSEAFAEGPPATTTPTARTPTTTALAAPAVIGPPPTTPVPALGAAPPDVTTTLPGPVGATTTTIPRPGLGLPPPAPAPAGARPGLQLPPGASLTIRGKGFGYTVSGTQQRKAQELRQTEATDLANLTQSEAAVNRALDSIKKGAVADASFHGLHGPTTGETPGSSTQVENLIGRGLDLLPAWIHPPITKGEPMTGPYRGSIMAFLTKHFDGPAEEQFSKLQSDLNDARFAVFVLSGKRLSKMEADMFDVSMPNIHDPTKIAIAKLERLNILIRSLRELKASYSQVSPEQRAVTEQTLLRTSLNNWMDQDGTPRGKTVEEQQAIADKMRAAQALERPTPPQWYQPTAEDMAPGAGGGAPPPAGPPPTAGGGFQGFVQ